jgi:hypothetical protein
MGKKEKKKPVCLPVADPCFHEDALYQNGVYICECGEIIDELDYNLLKQSLDDTRTE